MHHYTGYGSRSTHIPQSEPIPGRESEMHVNSTGGYTFVLDDMARLRRFLILGTVGGSYYASERKLTKENLDTVNRLLHAGRGVEVVRCIVDISEQGRAPSNDPALFALACCCASADVATRRAAYASLPQVARTGTHLFHFTEFVKQFRGRGRLHRRALKAWYNGMSSEELAYQLLKYQARDGWSHRDALRLTRPMPATPAHNALYHWVVKGWDAVPSSVPSEKAMGLIWAYEQAKRMKNPEQVASLIQTYHLTREMIPTEHLASVPVWYALLEHMPLEALVRNLATMTRHGVFAPGSDAMSRVMTRLRSQKAIQKARLHPIKLLAALLTYAAGRSMRGDARWTPLPQIIDALNDAFYLAFTNVEPSNKHIVLALDVSGSMSLGTIAGVPGLTPRVASAALALVTAAVEPLYTVMGFSKGFIPLALSPRQRLDDVTRTISDLPFDSTDCARPMLWALEKNVKADAFVVLTDNETNAYGQMHPALALERYRQKTGIPAKLIVVGMTATNFSIADPADGGMLDVVGFDTNTPALMSEFIAGRM